MMTVDLSDRDAKTAQLLELLDAVERRLKEICTKAERILASSSNGAPTPHA